MNKDFLEDSIYKAKNVWKWKSPWISAILAFIHPLGLLYNSSFFSFFVYIGLWFNMNIYWTNKPIGIGILLALIFSIYAFINTRWKNAAIEKWRYGLSGTGKQNPKKLNIKLKGPDKI